ncbi:putative 26S proteasome non-ATPase regulatory subunit 10 [Paratrimastix pyriformis]|uniref:26S proteasome non-ATPase regulatory subunit 10 n=1 Tax=Paratrimastix pyriformis TaxID=342808 RepID=A0ABQ8V094_9EUKA|nr:putative 26S proteasome non-ATPase regulatory subunit 10 [Paratrimastix pyriformis]
MKSRIEIRIARVLFNKDHRFNRLVERSSTLGRYGLNFLREAVCCFIRTGSTSYHHLNRCASFKDAVDADGRTALSLAVIQGVPEAVSSLLQQGVQCDALDEDYRTPLHHASFAGRLDLAKMLVSRGARIDSHDKHGHTPLHLAVMSGNFELVNFLLDSGAKVSSTFLEGGQALHLAAVHREPVIANLLLERGAEVDAADKSGCTPLHRAALKGFTEVVAVLLDHRASMEARDKTGWKPLHLAAAQGNLEVVELLVERGAQLDFPFPVRRRVVLPRGVRAGVGSMTLPWFWLVLIIPRSLACSLARPPQDGLSPLGIACLYGRMPVVRFLLERGASIDAYQSVRRPTHLLPARPSHPGLSLGGLQIAGTPLHVACKSGHAAIGELLLDAGASVESQNQLGQRPLHLACVGGSADTVQMLLRRGACPTSIDLNGQCPLDLAPDEARPRLENLFRLLAAPLATASSPRRAGRRPPSASSARSPRTPRSSQYGTGSMPAHFEQDDGQSQAPSDWRQAPPHGGTLPASPRSGTTPSQQWSDGAGGQSLLYTHDAPEPGRHTGSQPHSRRQQHEPDGPHNRRGRSRSPSPGSASRERSRGSRDQERDRDTDRYEEEPDDLSDRPSRPASWGGGRSGESDEDRPSRGPEADERDGQAWDDRRTSTGRHTSGRPRPHAGSPRLTSPGPAAHGRPGAPRVPPLRFVRPEAELEPHRRRSGSRSPPAPVSARTDSASWGRRHGHDHGSSPRLERPAASESEQQQQQPRHRAPVPPATTRSPPLAGQNRSPPHVERYMPRASALGPSSEGVSEEPSDAAWAPRPPPPSSPHHRKQHPARALGEEDERSLSQTSLGAHGRRRALEGMRRDEDRRERGEEEEEEEDPPIPDGRAWTLGQQSSSESRRHRSSGRHSPTRRHRRRPSRGPQQPGADTAEAEGTVRLSVPEATVLPATTTSPYARARVLHKAVVASFFGPVRHGPEPQQPRSPQRQGASPRRRHQHPHSPSPSHPPPPIRSAPTPPSPHHHHSPPRPAVMLSPRELGHLPAFSGYSPPIPPAFASPGATARVIVPSPRLNPFSPTRSASGSPPPPPSPPPITLTIPAVAQTQPMFPLQTPALSTTAYPPASFTRQQAAVSPPRSSADANDPRPHWRQTNMGPTRPSPGGPGSPHSPVLIPSMQQLALVTVSPARSSPLTSSPWGAARNALPLPPAGGVSAPSPAGFSPPCPFIRIASRGSPLAQTPDLVVITTFLRFFLGFFLYLSAFRVLPGGLFVFCAFRHKGLIELFDHES